MSYKLIDTTAALTSFLDTLQNLATSQPSLYIDLEGINLSRQGTISLIQILVQPAKLVYILDVHILGQATFSTTDLSGKNSLRTIFESERIPKVFFDVRNDSDALFSHFKISLKGIQDLQLMQLATRNSSKKFVSGLAKCLERDAGMTYKESAKWLTIKEEGKALFAPELGGSYEVFNARPLSSKIMAYCVQDVTFLPVLWLRYNKQLSTEWWAIIHQTSKDRVLESQSPTYNGHGKQKAIGPWPEYELPKLKPTVLRKSDTVDVHTMSLGLESLALEKVSESNVTSETKAESDASAVNILTLKKSIDNIFIDEFDDDLSNEFDGDFGQDFETDSGWYDQEGLEPDFTACSSEDCGYCGKCGY